MIWLGPTNKGWWLISQCNAEFPGMHTHTHSLSLGLSFTLTNEGPERTKQNEPGGPHQLNAPGDLYNKREAHWQTKSTSSSLRWHHIKEHNLKASTVTAFTSSRLSCPPRSRFSPSLSCVRENSAALQPRKVSPNETGKSDKDCKDSLGLARKTVNL